MNKKDTIEKLFEEIKHTDNFKEIGQIRHEYNIFEVLAIDDKEVPMTKVLADLLNPRGRHDIGSTFLESFLEKIKETKKLPDNWNLEETHVRTEFHTNENRRIDIFLENNKFIYVIEVKINAGDQENQIYDYLLFAKNKYSCETSKKEIKAIYLTPYGTRPSVTSTTSPDGTETCKEDVLLFPWTSICNIIDETEKDLKPSNLKSILIQYKEAIKKYANEELMKLNNDILEMITNNPDYYHILKHLCNNLNDRVAADYVNDKIYNQLIETFESTEAFKILPLEKGYTKGFYKITGCYKEIDGPIQLYFTIGKSEGTSPYSIGFQVGPENLEDAGKHEEFMTNVFLPAKDKIRKAFNGEIDDNVKNSDSDYNWISWRYLDSINENNTEPYIDFFYLTHSGSKEFNVVINDFVRDSIDQINKYLTKKGKIILEIIESNKTNNSITI